MLAFAAGGCAAGGGSAAACIQHACQCHAGPIVVSPLVITMLAEGRLEYQRVRTSVRQSSRDVRHTVDKEHAQDRRWNGMTILEGQPYRIGI